MVFLRVASVPGTKTHRAGVETNLEGKRLLPLADALRMVAWGQNSGEHAAHCVAPGLAPSGHRAWRSAAGGTAAVGKQQ